MSARVIDSNSNRQHPTQRPKRLTLWQAVAISALLHVFVIFGGLIHLPIDSPPAASITVTLKTVPPALPPDTPRKPQTTGKKQEKARIRNEAHKPADAKNNTPTTAPDATPQAAEPPPDNAPAQLSEAAGTPDYPPDAQQNGLQGCVLAAVYIDDKGKVSAVRILHSDHPGIFDASMSNAQRHARYLPAIENGRTIAGRALAVAAFSLTAAGHTDCPLRYAPLAASINALPPEASLDAVLASQLPQLTPPSSATVPHAK